MLVPFESLPDSSRVWIYQSNRSFTEEELVEIKKKLDEFLTQWTVHGANLQAGYEIKYKRFITIGLNQEVNAASGCSIDASVHFIQTLEKEYNVDLLDKMNVSFKQGEFVAYKPLAVNNLVNNKAEYLSDWEVPAAESWHKRFMS